LISPSTSCLVFIELRRCKLYRMQAALLKLSTMQEYF
jgi:hypothetical protein